MAAGPYGGTVATLNTIVAALPVVIRHTFAAEIPRVRGGSDEGSPRQPGAVKGAVRSAAG